MAITKILNIQESDGRNPASHLKNALEYIQNPDKTEECVLVGSINCLPDTAFEQMEETKNIFHKTGKRQGYHVIISFSPEEKVTAEQAMYVLEHFAKDVLGDDYEAVYAVHTDREHMHGHLIWNSVSMTTGKKYNSPKGNWKNHLQPITNKYCDELGLSIMPAEYSRNPKNISRDKWEKEMSMKEIILRDAKMCAYAAGNVEHFKYLMKRLGYVFKKDAWMEVQAPGFRYYHKLAKLDEMFSEDMLRHHVDMPWMVKSKVVPPEYIGVLDANIKVYFLEDSGTTLNTLDGSKYNIIISNTQKIILKAQHKEKSSVDKLFSDQVPGQSVLDDVLGILQEISNNDDLMSNQRFEKLTRLSQMGIYVDEAHHMFGADLEKALHENGKGTSLRNTINKLSKELSKHGSKVVACYNFTGTPYVNNKILPEVIYAYGLQAAIRNNFLKDTSVIGYSNVKSKEFLKAVIVDFWAKYGGKEYEGLAPKMAIFGAEIAEVRDEIRPVVEEVLSELGIPLDKILVNVGDEKITKSEDIRDFNNLDIAGTAGSGK